MKVFAVEDEALLLMSLEDMLEELGCRVVGRAATVDEALRAAQSVDCDVAILDVNLAGLLVTPVADLLSARRIPFFFTSGYGGASLPAGHATRLLVPKPYSKATIGAALTTVAGAKPPG